MRVHIPPSRSARSLPGKRHAPGKADDNPPPGARRTILKTATASYRTKKRPVPGTRSKPNDKKATTLVKKKLIVAKKHVGDKKPMKKNTPVAKKGGPSNRALPETASPPPSSPAAPPRKTQPGSKGSLDINRSPTRPETAEVPKQKAKPKPKKTSLRKGDPLTKVAESGEALKSKKKPSGTKTLKRDSDDSDEKKTQKKTAKKVLVKPSVKVTAIKSKQPVKKTKSPPAKDASSKKSVLESVDSSEDSDEVLAKTLAKSNARKAKSSTEGTSRPKMSSPRREDAETKSLDAASKTTSKAKASESVGRVTSPPPSSKEEHDKARKKAAPKNLKRPLTDYPPKSPECERRSSIPSGQTNVAVVSLPTVSLQKMEKQVLFDTKVEQVTTGEKKKITARRKLSSTSTSTADSAADDIKDTAKSPSSPKNAGLIGKIVPKPLTDLLESRGSEVDAKKGKPNAEPSLSPKPKPVLNHAVTIKKIKWNDTHVTKVNKKDASESDKGSKASLANKHMSKTTSTLLAAKEKLAQWKAMVEHNEDSNSSDNVPLDLLFRGSETPSDVPIERDTSSSLGLLSSFKITPEMSENSRNEASKKKTNTEPKIFRKGIDGESGKKDKHVPSEGKKPAKDVYEFGVSSSDHGMSDSSLMKEKPASLMDKRKALQRKRVRIKKATAEKSAESASPTRLEGSGSDTDQKVKRFRLLGFWSGPKRHRLASLNAIAKVHCMFENESRPAFLGGFVSSSPSKPRTAAARAKPGPKRKPASKEKNESDNESIVEPAITTRALRTGHGIRGVGKHWDMTTAESTSSSDPPSSSSSSDNESSSDAATDPDSPKGTSSSNRKKRHKRPGTPQEKQRQDKKEAAAATKRRRKKREPCMDLKDMVVRKRMASLNATAILAASYCNEKRTPRKETTNDNEQKKESQIVPRSPSQPSPSPRPRVRAPSPSPILDGSEKEKPYEADEKVLLDDRHVIELRSSAGKGTTLILNKDADVTITGLYVNSTTRSTAHHEGFCSFAGLQYHISSTSHTQTEATAVATETVIHPSPAAPADHGGANRGGSPSQSGNNPSGPPANCKSYTPLVALSSMKPPEGHQNLPVGHPTHPGLPGHPGHPVVGHGYPYYPAAAGVPTSLAPLGRRIGCSAFSAPPTQHSQCSPYDSPPGYTHGECHPGWSSDKQMPQCGFYQPAGPLITAQGAHSHSPGGPPASGVRDVGPAGGTGGGPVGGGSDGDATKVSPNSPAASAGVREDSENDSQAASVASTTSSAAAVAAAAAAAAAVAAAAAAADQQASATAGFRYTTTASATYSPSGHQHLHPGPGPGPPPYPYGYAPSQFYPPLPQTTAAGIQYPPGAGHYHPQEICYPPNYPYGYRRYPAPPLYDMYQGPGGGPGPGGSAPLPAGRVTSPPPLQPPPPPQPTVVQSSSSVQSSQMVVSTGGPPPPPAPLDHPYPGPAGQFYSGYSTAHPHYYPPYRCPCPMQSCPKNVHTGPLTGDAGKGPTKHQPLPPVVLALPLEPSGALGPPSPARGSAGLPAPPSPAPGVTNAAFQGWDGVLAKSDPEAINFALKQDPATDIGLLTIGKLGDDKRPRKRARNGVLDDPWSHDTVCADLDLKPKSLKQETDTKIECPPKETVPNEPQKEVPQVEPCPPEAPAKRSVPSDDATTTAAKKQKKVPEVASVEVADKIKKTRNIETVPKGTKSQPKIPPAVTPPKTKPKSKVKSASLPPPVVNGSGAQPGAKGRRSKSQENTSKTEEKGKSKPLATTKGRRSSKNRRDPAEEEAAAAAVVAAAKLPESIPRSQCRKLIAHQKKLISRCQANKSKSEAKAKAKLAAESATPASASVAVAATPAAAPAPAVAAVGAGGVRVVDDPRIIAPAAVKTPKWSNGWSWQGEPFMAKVYLNSDDQPVERKCYSSMLHCEGDVVIPGDSVLLKSGTRKIDLPFVARVASLWENPEDGEMMVSLLWFYRPEHTDQGRRPEDTEDEIFASRHKDINSVACIEDKCYVLTYNEYCRYRKTVRRLEQGLAPPPLVVPPPVGGYPRLHKQPPGHVAPDMVFFCRRIYDFRQRRIQKSLS